MSNIDPEYFYNQFNRYEGEEKFKAAARHAAHLLQAKDKLEREFVDKLKSIRDELASGRSIVAIALDIQENISEMEQ